MSKESLAVEPNSMASSIESPLADVAVMLPIGGLALRAREVTNDAIPKHLIELGDKTVLDFVFDGLQSAGFRRFILCVGHHKEQIIEHVSREHWISDSNVTYDFSPEEEPLGADGAVMQALDKLGIEGRCLVVPGDVLLPWKELAAMCKQHSEREAGVTMSVTSVVTQTTTDVGKMIVEDETDRLVKIYGRNEEAAGDWPSCRRLTSAAATLLDVDAYKNLCEKYYTGNPAERGAALSLRDQMGPWALDNQAFEIYAHDLNGEVLDLGTPSNIHHGQQNWSSYV